MSIFKIKKKIIIGLGTGRCGTKSLSSLLRLQNDTLITHEHLKSELPWEINNKIFEKLLNQILIRKQSFVGDVGFYLLPYWKKIVNSHAESKFIILKRNKEDLVKSYIEKTMDKNPFQEHDGKKWYYYKWDKCYPKFEEQTKEDAIRHYYDHYYNLCQNIPKDKCIWLNTEDLNNKQICCNMLNFCGFKHPVFKIIKQNKTIKKTH